MTALKCHWGSIAEGYDADLVLFDENVEVHKTWGAGTEVYSRMKS